MEINVNLANQSCFMQTSDVKIHKKEVVICLAIQLCTIFKFANVSAAGKQVYIIICSRCLVVQVAISGSL